MIWIPNETEAWEAAQLVSSDTKSVTVKLKSGKEVKIPGAVTKFDAIPPGSLEEECDNLVNLENFSEGIILHHVPNLHIRGHHFGCSEPVQGIGYLRQQFDRQNLHADEV